MSETTNEPLDLRQSIGQQMPYEASTPTSEDKQPPQSLGKGNPDPEDNYDPPTSVFDADWQFNSILLFADQVCTWLNEGKSEQSPTEAMLCELIGHFIGAMELYYTTGLNVLQDLPPDNKPSAFNGAGLIGSNDPLAYERRRMVQIVGDEWNNLMRLVASARFLTQEAPVIKAIQEVVDQARGDLNLATILENRGQSPDRTVPSFAVLPHFGHDFELVSFRYAPGVFVLGVPVTSLYCPWNWTVIWHEMAGIYIQSERHLRRRAIDEGVVAAVYKSLNKLNDSKGRKALRNSYSNWLIRNQLISNDRFRFDETIRWNWAEELVEDAIGVLCMGEAMADVISSVLRAAYAPSQRNGSADGSTSDVSNRDWRHPPPELRIAVARHLVGLLTKRPIDNEDTYVLTIAQTILDHQSQLVNRPWSKDEEALYREQSIVIGRDGWLSGQNNTPIVLAAQLSEPAMQRVRYALIASAVHRGKLAGDTARLIFFQHTSQRQPGKQVDLKNLGLDGLTKDLLLEQTFSERDQFLLSFEHLAHTDSRTVNVSFSGTVHEKYHTGNFSWTHDH